MTMTDPVADMLTRMRNAIIRKHEKVDMPLSNLKKAIAHVLKQEGYIKDFKSVDDKKGGLLRIYLKYGPKSEQVINKIVRISKPGRRIYRKVSEIDRVLDGLGLAVVSTSKGVMGDKECRKLKLGGEILCEVW